MKNVKNYLYLLIFVVGAVGCSSVPSDPMVPTYDRICSEFADDWYGCYALDSKSGYHHGLFTLEEIDGKEVFVLRSESVNKMVAFDQKIEIGHKEELHFSTVEPFNFVGGFSEIRHNKEVQTFKVTVAEEGGYNAEIVQAGITTKRKVPAVNLTAYDTVFPVLHIKFKNPKVGEKIPFKSFDFEDLKEQHQFYEVTKVDTVSINGKDKKVYEMTYNSVRKGKIGTCIITEEGLMTSIKISEMFEYRLEDKENAMDFSFSKDIFRAALLKLNRPMCISPKRVSHMLLEAKGKGVKALEDGPTQRVVKKHGKIFLELKTSGWKKFPATEEEIKESLEHTVQYPCQDKRVIALAKKAAGDAKSVRQKAYNVLKFVDRYLKDTMKGNAVTVFQIMKQKKGDCSEHAMLYTALARAVGIPTREAHGYVYCSDNMLAFGGHAWNEVVIDGNWEPVDPSWGETHINATHIRCGSGEKNTMNEIAGCLNFDLIKLNGKDPIKFVPRKNKRKNRQVIPNVPVKEEKRQVIPNVPAK